MPPHDFDAIVIGAGMGGGAVGYTLAKAGLRVLFLERGIPSRSFAPELSGDYVERFIVERKLPRAATMAKAGRSPLRVNGAFPILGNGNGGSTAVYGALHLPFCAKDFASWPFSLAELQPYYDICDSLFQPRGTKDPLQENQRALREPAPLSGPGRELFDFFQTAGMHPYRSPIAYDNVDRCAKCFGIYCPRDCKRTAGNVFIEPAVRDFGARIEHEVSVDSLILDQRQCTGVACRTQHGAKTIRSRFVFIAAGALVTPVILRHSTSEMFPDGIGNHSDRVGRNLMRHLVDFYYVRTVSRDGIGEKLIEVSASDFHLKSDEGWGILNIVGGIMSPPLIAQTFLDQRLGDSALGQTVCRLAKPFMAKVIEYLLEGRMLVTSIMEDEAQSTNRILPGSTTENVRLHYGISPRDRSRLATFRKELLRLFRPLSPRLIKVAEDNMFLAHCCGTCRMGESPGTSVVDRTGKVHGAENVFVADASIFPSSGASNPSMTVAACGLKIADEFLRTSWST